MAKNKTQDTVVLDTTAPQTNETLTANVQTAVITPVVVLPIDTLKIALNSGLITQDAYDKLEGIIHEDYMATTLAKFKSDIIKREQDVLGQVYLDIEAAIVAGDMVTAGQIAQDNKITKIVITWNDNYVPSVMRTNFKTSNAVPAGERTKAGKWLFTNGNVSHESLRQFVGAYDPDTLTQSLNGIALCNKLKKHITADEWTVVNQDDKSTQPFAVWSAAKYNVQFN